MSEQWDEAMGPKLSLPALKVRRSLTLAGRKLPNREDGGMMASEMRGCCLPRIICPNVILSHGSLVPLAAPLPQGVRAAVIRQWH